MREGDAVNTPIMGGKASKSGCTFCPNKMFAATCESQIFHSIIEDIFSDRFLLDAVKA